MSPTRLPSGPRAGSRTFEVIHDLAQLRESLDGVRAGGERIAVVPTMGNLHAGHLALVRHARQVAEFTVATIFVNPFQFGANEDFDSYPRTLEQDVQALESAGCDVLFAPSAAAVYPNGLEGMTRVEVPGLGSILCGETRPTFFRGVATVVNILFSMVQPDVAMFGEKDYQQLLVIRRMVGDLHLRVQVDAVPTVREADGLAMSSRNNYLSPHERSRAVRLYQALRRAREALAAGESDYRSIARSGMDALVDAGFRPDYFTVRRQSDLGEPGPGDESLIVLGAAWMGRTRLIDNIKV